MRALVKLPSQGVTCKVIWGPYQRATRLYIRSLDHGSCATCRVSETLPGVRTWNSSRRQTNQELKGPSLTCLGFLNLQQRSVDVLRWPTALNRILQKRWA